MRPNKRCKPPGHVHRSEGLCARGMPASFEVDGWAKWHGWLENVWAELLDWKALTSAKWADPKLNSHRPRTEAPESFKGSRSDGAVGLNSYGMLFKRSSQICFSISKSQGTVLSAFLEKSRNIFLWEADTYMGSPDTYERRHQARGWKLAVNYHEPPGDPPGSFSFWAIRPCPIWLNIFPMTPLQSSVPP